ncbi:unnamed protein product [Brugia timori]|uniref:EAL domain-containing protein n=1 Tax=Brugia timori TaxID=42155 RepID=A0A0R3QTK4_9BILA|nr:unnamed protein product [Brugia timori]
MRSSACARSGVNETLREEASIKFSGFGCTKACRAFRTALTSYPASLCVSE